MSNDAFDWEQPEDMNTGGGNFLKSDGTYHLVVHDIVTADKGKSIDGFRANCEVLDGTVKEEKGRLANITFFNGKLSHKDNGKFARQKQAAIFIAANVLGPNDVQSILDRKPHVDLAKAQGQQIVATIEINEKGFAELAYTDVFHVDDPKAAQYPKDAAALKLIPKEFRRTPEELQAIKDAFAGKAATNGTKQSQPELAGAGVNLDDI